MLSGKSFPDNVNVDSFAKSELIEYLKPEDSYNNENDQLRPLAIGQETWSCAWSDNGEYLAWSSGHRIVRLIPCCTLKKDISKFEESRDNLKAVIIDAGETVWSLAFGQHTSQTTGQTRLVLATGLNSGRIRVWEIPSGRPILDLVDHNSIITDLCFVKDNSERLLSASEDGTLKIWQLQDHGNMVATMKSVQYSCTYGCAWSSDSNIAVSVGDRKSVIIWDMETYKQIRRLEGHNHIVCSCAFSSDGALLVTASYDTRVIVWDPYTGRKLHILGHMFPSPSPIFAGGANGSYVRSIAFSPDSRHIVTACDDSYIRFWDIYSQADSPIEICTVENALCVSYSADGNSIAVGNRNGTLSLWNAPGSLSSLKELCRSVVRRKHTNSTLISSLEVPLQLKDFLVYLY